MWALGDITDYILKWNMRFFFFNATILNSPSSISKGVSLIIFAIPPPTLITQWLFLGKKYWKSNLKLPLSIRLIFSMPHTVMLSTYSNVLNVNLLCFVSSFFKQYIITFFHYYRIIQNSFIGLKILCVCILPWWMAYLFKYN